MVVAGTAANLKFFRVELQELRREFSKWSTVSYAISILGVLGSVPATLGQPLAVGGPGTAVWCWLIGSCMALLIGSSVAELVSAYPTAGGTPPFL